MYIRNIMNLNLFLLPDPSGILSKEKIFSKDHPLEYKYILEYSIKYNLENLSFREKCYYALNKLNNIIKCKNDTCIKKPNFKSIKLGYHEYCSLSCTTTCDKMIERKKETNIIKYGYEIPQHSDIIKNKIKLTCNDKYGGNSPMSSKVVQEKSKHTCLKMYGVDNPNKCKEIIEKRVNTFKNNIEQYKETYKNTSLIKYGVEHPWMVKEIHQKSIDNSIPIRNNILFNKIKNIEENIFDNIINIDYNNRTLELTCVNSHTYNILYSDLYYKHKHNIELCNVCNPKKDNESFPEKEILKFITNNYDGVIITNTQKIIKPLELDIYLPELNLAFEHNGIFWHSELRKTKDYHKIKTNKCKELGINLIHIWGDEWRHNRYNIENYILSLLNKKINTNYKLNNITNNESISFLIDYSLEYTVMNSIYHIGIFKNDILNGVINITKNNKNEYYISNYGFLSYTYENLTENLINYCKVILNIESLYFYEHLSKYKTIDLNLINPIKVYKLDYYLIDNKRRIHRANINTKNKQLIKIWDSGKIKYKIF